MVLLVAKAIDNMKVAGVENNALILVVQFNKRFELGTVTSGPGKLRIFGIDTTQQEHMTISTDADVRLSSLNEYSLALIRRKQSDDLTNDFEKLIFAATNSSLGWKSSAAPPFCLFYALHLQQKSSQTKMYHLVKRKSILQKLKKFGTIISYPRSSDKPRYELTVLAFVDASKGDTYEQPGILSGLLVGEFAQDPIFHCAS